MDIQRTILWVIFSMSLLFLWDSWQRHQGQTSMFFGAPATTQSGAAPATPAANAVPGDIPQAMPGNVAATPSAAAPASGTVPGVTAAEAPSERITVRTDLMDAAIDTQGAQLVRLELLKYKDADDNQKNLVLLDQSPSRVYLAQTGLISAADGISFPTHRTPFVAVPGPRELADGQDTLAVRFEAESGGMRLIKTYTFTRGSYVIGVRHDVVNTGAAPQAVQLYQQLLRDGGKPAGESFFYSTFTGPAVYTEAAKFQKVKFEDIEKGVGQDKHATQAADGWVAMIQHYFVSAWLPAKGVARQIYTEKVDTNLYRVGMKEALGTIEPGATLTNESRLFAGPQEERLLERTAPGLDLVRDYGWLTVLSKPLFWLLEKLHGMLGNWGWAIVALTVLIKLAFYPLSAASYKSMAKMKQVAPRMKAIQDRHKEDRMKMNQAMMELYKVEKINPMGGCLPILVQIPVFIALYWALLASVEMRNAPWIGWIHDLAAPDPWFILPVVMMASMFVQYKLNPTPPDPVQAKIMLFMPLIFGVMFFFFPAGLVLYWVVNNILSILQQWRITKVIEAGGNGNGGNGKG